jgi:hypothetical protein
MRHPYAEVEFTSKGELHDPVQQTAAIDLVRTSGASDVLVLVHGWNNDMQLARRLFDELSASLADVAGDVPGADARQLAVIGVLWPSVRWADEDQIAGGGVGLFDEQQDLRAAIAASVDDLSTAALLEELVPQLESSPEARDRFLELLRTRIPEPAEDDEDAPPTPLLEGTTQTVFDEASVPDTELGAPVDEGAASGGGSTLGGFGAEPGAGTPGADDLGGAAGFGVGGVLRGARTLLNLTTYYTMKRRAGEVGARGVAPLLAALAAEVPEVRRHLAGHSFGARVVAAAIAEGPTVHAVGLLQGAFSHHGFAKDHDGRGHPGAFRAALAPSPRIAGPMIVTHTRNDKAVGVAYAAASRIARQRASGFGGPDDVYGGIGSNGALRTPEAEGPPLTLGAVGADYRLTPGRVHNLRADRYVTGHSAVTGREVAYALLTAMVTPG